jgi:hypothetical protein
VLLHLACVVDELPLEAWVPDVAVTLQPMQMIPKTVLIIICRAGLDIIRPYMYELIAGFQINYFSRNFDRGWRVICFPCNHH